jgi:hypothetical protein
MYICDMDMTIKIYKCEYRAKDGYVLDTKLWYAMSWMEAFVIAQTYMDNKCDNTFDFILQLDK